MPEYLQRKHHAPIVPMAPTREMLETGFPPLDVMGVPSEERPRPKEPAPPAKPTNPTEANPFLRFEFKRPWFGEYATKEHKFVLRVEHFPELNRLVNEFNKNRAGDEFPIGASDIVSAALDFILEHPLVLTGVTQPAQIREAMAKAVYRKAFFRFFQLYGQI